MNPISMLCGRLYQRRRLLVQGVGAWGDNIVRRGLREVSGGPPTLGTPGIYTDTKSWSLASRKAANLLQHEAGEDDVDLYGGIACLGACQ